MEKGRIIGVIILLLGSVAGFSQVNTSVIPNRCATIERLENRFSRNPVLKTRFEAERSFFNRVMSEGGIDIPDTANKVSAIFTIPVIFHIVHSNPSAITNAQIQAQLDTLNKAFSGTNGDTARIPSYFISLFGRSGIRFCLAQRTPEGESTNGIDRVTTSKTSFSVDDDGVKYPSAGGVAAWDPSRYLNVWICTISTNILGYATFPGDGIEAEQGIVIDYRSLPGSTFTNYNGGKSLVHETGHYFNLYHIWGDDNGACSGTDYVDDTPNQAISTTGCLSGIRTDNCTPSGNGIMYQNYMDYSYDACMVMFTNQQISRAETALTLYRSSLLTSDACEPINLKDLDAQLLLINEPAQRLCSPSFTPVITIKNKGAQVLSSLNITIKIDGVIVGTSSWTGSLARTLSIETSLRSFTASVGNHTLSITVSEPNANQDQAPDDNTLTLAFQYYLPTDTVSESFETIAFPPAGWDVLNRDQGTTWQRITGVAKSGNASVRINNSENTTGQKDELRLPDLTIASTVDTSYLSFQLASAAFNAASIPDTLEIGVSTDCGDSYTTIYKKWGSSLTTTTATENSFSPSAADWRKDSVDLSRYIGTAGLLIAFKYSHEQANNIYLDDINLRNVTVNPNLKAQGFLVTPNPTSGAIAVQFYPQPKNLIRMEIYSSAGQKLAVISTSQGQNNYYRFDLGRYAAGTYILRAVFSDKVILRKIIKY